METNHPRLRAIRPDETPASRTTRLSVNINDETADDLRYLAEKRGLTITELIRRSVAVYNYLWTEQASGRTIRLRESRRQWWGGHRTVLTGLELL